MESESRAANWHAMNRHFPCSAMMDAGWNSTQHHCLRGDHETPFFHEHCIPLCATLVRECNGDIGRL